METCKTCCGFGRFDDIPCPRCGGTGTVAPNSVQLPLFSVDSGGRVHYRENTKTVILGRTTFVTPQKEKETAQ